ncbi:MAG: diguanylate cyclase [Acidobacteriia bacterium]|nr:diguanylate cyclase [Terriglobia bacterium]
MNELCDLFRTLGDSLDLEETLSNFDRELRRLVAYAALSLHLVEDGRLIPAYAAGEEFRALASLESRLGEGFLGRAAAECRPVLNCHLDALGRLATALVVPLEHRGAAIAVVTLYHDQARVFSQEDLETLLAVAPKLTASIDNARRYRAAERLTGIDLVTGALNTRALFQQLDAELARARRLRESLAVIECAVEGMDESLPELAQRLYRQLAASLRECCREYDSVARTGDGFVLVLAAFTPADFEEKHARIQRAVEELGLRAGLPLSASVGAAFFPKDASDAEGLLATAAERLRLVWRGAHGDADGVS